MANLIFLAVAAAIIFVGVTVLWVRDRARTRFDASIHRFEAEMGALAPARVGESRRRVARGGRDRS